MHNRHLPDIEKRIGEIHQAGAILGDAHAGHDHVDLALFQRRYEAGEGQLHEADFAAENFSNRGGVIGFDTHVLPILSVGQRRVLRRQADLEYALGVHRCGHDQHKGRNNCEERATGLREMSKLKTHTAYPWCGRYRARALIIDPVSLHNACGHAN